MRQRLPVQSVRIGQINDNNLVVRGDSKSVSFLRMPLDRLNGIVAITCGGNT